VIVDEAASATPSSENFKEINVGRSPHSIFDDEKKSATHIMYHNQFKKV
jgi:hypothetical protein